MGKFFKTAATWTSTRTIKGKKVFIEHSNKKLEGGVKPKKDENY